MMERFQSLRANRLILRRELDENLAVLNLNLVRKRRLSSGHRSCLSSSNIELRPVARTGNAVSNQLALAEWPTIVGAQVVDTMKAVFQSHDDDVAAVDFSF
jgi:hypothetical protein